MHTSSQPGRSVSSSKPENSNPQQPVGPFNGRCKVSVLMMSPQKFVQVQRLQFTWLQNLVVPEFLDVGEDLSDDFVTPKLLYSRLH